MSEAVRRDPAEVLRTVFGFDSFRGHQAEIIAHLRHILESRVVDRREYESDADLA